MTLSRALFAFLVVLASPAAAQVWNRHALDYVALETGRVQWIVHGRIQAHGTRPDQARAGVRAAVEVSSRVEWTAGYYYISERDGDGSWSREQRPFTGPEITIAESRPAAISFRSLVEAQIPEGQPHYFRFRERVQAQTSLPAGPFASFEVLFDNLGGWRGNRYVAGLRWNMGTSVIVEVSYLADAQAARIGPARHMIQTVWTVRRPHGGGGPGASDQRTSRGRQ